jgi:hypothetical protein
MDAAQAGYVPGTMSMLGMIGFGARNTASQVQRTTHIDSVGAGLHKTITVPPFSASFFLVQSDQTDVATIELEDTSGAVIYSVTTTGNMAAPVPISVDCVTADVSPSKNGVNMRLMFNLCL